MVDARLGSNQRPPRCQRGALPLSYASGRREGGYIDGGGRRQAAGQAAWASAGKRAPVRSSETDQSRASTAASLTWVATRTALDEPLPGPFPYRSHRARRGARRALRNLSMPRDRRDPAARRPGPVRPVLPPLRTPGRQRDRRRQARSAYLRLRPNSLLLSAGTTAYSGRSASRHSASTLSLVTSGSGPSGIARGGGGNPNGASSRLIRRPGNETPSIAPLQSIARH